MNVVIAAIDNSAAARPVLAVAQAAAEILGATVEAVHAPPNDDRTAAATAEAAGVALRHIPGPAGRGIVEEARRADVAALVLGFRRSPVRAWPAGHVVMNVIQTVVKPVILVPPETPAAFSIRRVLVPMEGDPGTAASLGATIEVVRASDIEIVVLNVVNGRSLPSFGDQPQHETDAWAWEFLSRYVPLPPETVRLELRVGVPAEEVLGVAAQSRVDMIALGWGRDLSPGHASIVRPVLARATVPILLVPVFRPEPASAGLRVAGREASPGSGS